MVIRQSTPEDLPEILRLIAAARAFMVERGNPSQWPEGYPSAEQLSSDIARGHSYVCVAPEYAGLVGTFYFAVEEEPSYQHIEGRWLNNNLYATNQITAGTLPGVGAFTHGVNRFVLNPDYG